jgi:hypothetical protein
MALDLSTPKAVTPSEERSPLEKMSFKPTVLDRNQLTNITPADSSTFYPFPSQNKFVHPDKVNVEASVDLRITPGQWPAQGPFTNDFDEKHPGIDIAGKKGSPITAWKEGEVTKIEHSDKGLGSSIQISHPDGTTTRYGHNSKILVKEGQKIEQGQIIAEMGSTGFSTSDHLHFELKLPDGKRANPLDYLPSKDPSLPEFITKQKTVDPETREQLAQALELLAKKAGIHSPTSDIPQKLSIRAEEVRSGENIEQATKELQVLSGFTLQEGVLGVSTLINRYDLFAKIQQASESIASAYFSTEGQSLAPTGDPTGLRTKTLLAGLLKEQVPFDTRTFLKWTDNKLSAGSYLNEREFPQSGIGGEKLPEGLLLPSEEPWWKNELPRIETLTQLSERDVLIVLKAVGFTEQKDFENLLQFSKNSSTLNTQIIVIENNSDGETIQRAGLFSLRNYGEGRHNFNPHNPYDSALSVFDLYGTDTSKIFGPGKSPPITEETKSAVSTFLEEDKKREASPNPPQLPRKNI